MSTTLIEAAALALAALATCNSNDGDDPWFDHEKVYSAREALRAALAQATPEDCGSCWPIANLAVDAAGLCTETTMYAPSLPEGNHDVWCVPIEAASENARLRAAMNEAMPFTMTIGQQMLKDALKA